MIVFGYGSLVYRPGFAYERVEDGYIRGYVRRFWQGSTDHRGVPGAPGRVVTLVPTVGAVCWGRAYWVAPTEADRVLAELDHREKGGYERARMPFHAPRGEVVEDVLVYRATPDNPEYLGDAPLSALVHQIRHSVGPSGANIDYVLRLDDALREMGAEDPHVRALAEALRRDA